MATSINAILNIGAGALFANQTAIQTTGNNIANVNTEGYSRQQVRFEEYPCIDFYPGQMGQGVRAAEVYRMFNSFVEKAYLSKSGMESRWAEQAGLLNTVEPLFNEANSPGIASSLDAFFSAWQQLSQDAASLSNRQALLSNATNLTAFINETYAALSYMQQQIGGLGYANPLGTMQGQSGGLILADIERANTLIQEIADLNRQINMHSVPGANNPNTLMDQRDLKVRELATIVDIDVMDRGEGHYTIHTKGGMTLVEEGVAYSFEYLGPRSYKYPTPGSVYNGTVGFDGADSHEYFIQVVDGGTVDTTGTAPAGTATFKVSLDGGRTWLKDDSGGDAIFYATDVDHKNNINNLGIYFDPTAGNLIAGDRFEIVPKTGIYWNSPTTGLINVTPQTYADGTENTSRLTGGSLAGYFNFRDNQVGAYRDQLDALTRALIWEVNRIHSQGVGLEKNTFILGDYKVENTTVPLGGTMSGLVWADRLQAGNFSFAIYDKTTGEPVLVEPGVEAICTINFDPATDSLQDLVTRINADPNASLYVHADIVDNRLQLQAINSDQTFAVEADTSGLLAGLGINTFFKGDSAANIAVTDRIVSNLNYINAGRVNGAAEGNPGDNITAREIAELINKAVTISSSKGTTKQTLMQFYAALVAQVGGDTAAAKFNAAFYGAMAKDLRDQQDANSGVNLDEEMTNLVRFQNSYKAAAKLITTADQMLQTILGLKQ